MADSLNSYLVAQPTDYTLDEEYNAFVESMIPVLKTTGDVREIVVDPEVGYLNRFDMAAFLLDNAIPLEDHRMILRMNGMTSTQELDENVRTLLLPDQQLVNRLKQIYRTKI